MTKSKFCFAGKKTAIGGKLLLALLLVMEYSILSAQLEENPYSRFGIGTLVSPAFSANRGMGYLSAPFASAININAANPASYAFLTRTTAEIGVGIDGVNVVANDSAHNGARAGITHFALAFVPPTKHEDHRWALTLALLPYSVVNYNFVQNFNDSVTGIGPYSQSYIGTGQLYQILVGGAYKYKGFSMGVNLGYVFGKLQYEKTNTFSDTANAMNTENYVNMNASGFVYNVGLMYQVRLYHNAEDPDVRKDIFAYFGAYGSGGATLNTKTSEYWDRSFANPSNDSSLTVADTLQSTYNQKGTIKVPYNFAAGVMFGNERFWMVGADFKYQNWVNFTTPLDNGGLVNSWQVSLGMQVIPNEDGRGYLNHVQYRLGAYYGKSDMVIGTSNLSQGGATLSFGLPLGTPACHLNFTGDFGSMGAPGPSIIRVNYYRFNLGFVLNDQWFYRHKFE